MSSPSGSNGSVPRTLEDDIIPKCHIQTKQSFTFIVGDTDELKMPWSVIHHWTLFGGKLNDK